MTWMERWKPTYLPVDCSLCGDLNPKVRMAVIRWKDGSLDAAPRCEDRAACRARVQAAGEEWPTKDVPEKRR